MKRIIVAALAALSLAGCATHAAIADLESDKVVVRASGNDGNVIRRQADAGCAVHKKRATPISHQCLDSYCITVDYLFACID